MDQTTMKKVVELLSNPEALSKITTLAKGLSSPEAPQPEVEVSTSKPTFSPETDYRSGLLVALKPLLKSNKQDKIDKLIKALTITSVIKNMKNQNFNI